jgi:hypothetical protein
MTAATIFILWTWGLTPLWVNVVCTVLLGLQILGNICKIITEEGK